MAPAGPAGVQINGCERCGAAVHDEDLDTHVSWHAELDDFFAAVREVWRITS